MTQTNVDEINKYLMWVRDKQLYPPQNSPEEYAEWVEMSVASGRLKRIVDIVKDGTLTDEEFRDKIEEIVIDMEEY